MNIVHIIALILGAIWAGFSTGIFPAAVAMKRRNMKYAYISFSICMFAGLLGGLRLSVPSAFIMIVIILFKVPAPSKEEVAEELKIRMNKN